MSDLIPDPTDRPPRVHTAAGAGVRSGAHGPLAAPNGSPQSESPTVPAEAEAEAEAGVGTETEAETGGGGGTGSDGETETGDPAVPAPLGIPRASTGNTAVDAVLERLADADHLPAEGHLAVYEDVHRGLRDTLTALDTPQPGPFAPGPQSPPYDHRS
ncbi:hypothetical protein [Streptomyces sp. NPDC059076]|uniref:hypothetical protein n=1 Tax=unclassified Streptomyces TaxID=2593676 RepID=UPI0036B3A557